MRIQSKITVLGLALGFSALALADIPFFWLDKPAGRTNKNDPNSPLFVRTNTPGIAGTSTFTRTATPYYSPTLTATRTETPNPANSATFTPTNSPVVNTATPSQTPVPGSHGSGVSDAEIGLQTEWAQVAGTIYVSKDGVTTANPDPFVVTAGGSTLPGGTAGNAFCYNGTIANTSATPWPYSVLAFDLVAGWTLGSAGVDVTPYAPTNSLSFSIKANVAPSSYKVDLTSMGITTYNYFEYQFTLNNTAWNRIHVYFPDGAGVPKLAQASGPFATWATEKLNIGQVRIQPVTTGPFNYDFCVDDVTFAAVPTATPTATPTSTPNYSPTHTPTPLAGFSGLWYDGETAGALASDVTLLALGGASDTPGVVEMTDGGASGANYIRLTASAASGSFFVAGQVARTQEDLTVGPFTKLSIAFRVSGPSCPMPAVQLNSANPVTYNAGSIAISLAKYVSPQVPISANTWYTAVIPLSEFIGANSDGGNFAGSELAQITGVTIRPESRSYYGGAITNAQIDVDTISFGAGTSPAVLAQPRIFGDFESPAATGASASNWGTYFYVFSDREPSPAWPATDCTGNGGTVTSWTYPGIGGNPVDTGGGGATSCLAMHISGNKGGNGAGGPGSCNANYSYIGSGMSFGTATETVNPTTCMTTACSWEAARTSPMAVDMKAMMGLSGDLQGIRFKARKGTNHAAGQSYLIVIETETRVCGGGDFQHRITDGQLSSSWQNFDIPFPAVGTLGKSGGDPAIDSGFGQPSWTGCEIAWTNNFRAMSFSVEGNNMTFDLWVDDIEFY